MAAEPATGMNGPAPDGAGDLPLLILVGSGAELYREYLISAAAARYRLWLMNPKPPTWELPYLAGHTVVDNTDPELLVAASRELAATHQVSGVFCYDEGLVWPAAHAAQALGLPGNTPDAIRACRDKDLTRELLTAAGVAQPASRRVASLAEARQAAAEIGYPVVLKPRGLAGSKGVLRVDGPDQLEAAYTAARAASYPGVPVYQAGVLVEEYLDGPEISVDASYFDGECIPMVVARKQVGFDPFFEEVGHVVDGADPLLEDATLREELRRSHAVLGFRYGVTHTEFKLTSRGPRLIEVNARLGGDLIPYLGMLASGVDPGLAAADAAAGRRPAPTFRWSKVAAIRFLYPEQDIEVEAIQVHDTDDPRVHQAVAAEPPGTELRLPPRGYISRYGFVTVVTDTPEEATALLERAPRIVELKGRPLPVEGAP